MAQSMVVADVSPPAPKMSLKIVYQSIHSQLEMQVQNKI